MSKRKTGDFTPRFSGCCASVFNLKNIEDGYRENELIALFDLPAHWLMNQMNNYCVGANYVFLDGKHYYTVHHS